MKRLVAFAITASIVALATHAHAESLTDDQRKALVSTDEAGDAWLHEHCAFRGTTSPTTVNGDVPGQVVELVAEGTSPLAKEFRCAERPPFHKGAWTPAAPQEVACSAPKPGRLCVPPLGATALPAVVALQPASATPKTTPPRSAAPPAARVESGGAAPVLGWLLVGTGIAGLITTGIAGGMVLDAKATAASHCDRFKTCDADGLAAAERGRTASLVGTIAFGASAAALTGGIVLLVVAKPREKQVSVVARPGAAGGSFALEGSF